MREADNAAAGVGARGLKQDAGSGCISLPLESGGLTTKEAC